MTSLDLSGQTALVTGASGGIGRAIALSLATAGADVIVHGCRNLESLEKLAAEIQQLGLKASILKADLADAAAIEKLAAAAWQWQGKLDLLVNNAGADVLTGDAAKWSFEKKLAQLWQVDVLGCVTLSRLLGPRMRERGSGSILNIGWDQAERGMAGDAGEMFGTIKGAVIAFTRSLAQSLAPQVRVNCLALGWIRTAWGEQSSDYWQERAKLESLRERWGTPADVAAAVTFLASPAADFITGQVIDLNGGFRFGAKR
ncbi:SDR family NAD(P)-dependent oxidoreductase [Anatilimnocola floriformis]|uniref:SDR family NAD(P)-dependent oxidoreductase n=1 Tax=Anatilimnocola floriformis TaxID=2948575 RepID=UPI0020C596D3|nr:SDR family oxidoreductase [Anatilimnocola floriformis]